jgi:NAD(P)-dependent dehydrogenase (short-subunit alcohol dehydrogenase family)
VGTPLRFDGEVVIVTGAGRGLGRSHALLMAGRGARVVVNDLGCGPLDTAGGVEPGIAEAVASEIRERGGEAIASDGDVATDAGAIVAAAVDTWGRLDALVNNAGIVGAGHFPTRDPAIFETMFRVHALGTVNMTRAAWPHLAGTQGRIVNTTSGAVIGLPEQTDYAAAKGAVLGFTRAVAIDGRSNGIRVNAVMPVAETRMWGATQHEYDDTAVTDTSAMGAALPPEGVSPVVAWLAHDSVPCTGQVFEAAGGHASRLALAFGTAVAGSTPEEYAAQYQILADTEALTVPADLNEVIGARLGAITKEAAQSPGPTSA